MAEVITRLDGNDALRYGIYLLPFFESALKRVKEITGRNLLTWCIEGTAQAWLVQSETKLLGAAATQVIDYPQRSVLRIIALSGKNMELWAEKLDAAIHDYARQTGCWKVELVGRFGFSRVLPKYGYTRKHIVMEKEVEYGQSCRSY